MKTISMILLSVANAAASNRYKPRHKQTFSFPSDNLEKNQLANDFIFLINIDIITGLSHKRSPKLS